MLYLVLISPELCISDISIISASSMEALETQSQGQNLQSSLIESFKLGRTLLQNQKERMPSKFAIKKEFELFFARKESSLSSFVHQLICQDFQNTTVSCHIQENLFTDAGHLCLDKVKEVLGKDITSSYQECDFREAVHRLHPICHVVHEEFCHLSKEHFEAQYKASLQWMACATRFFECFELLKSSNTANHILCLLLVTSSLEHILGDVYLSVSSSLQCPSLLKDLLATQEIKNIFGDTVVCLLRVLMGPPSSLNLRNILWHGFAAPGEVPTQYGSFLLAITVSLQNKFEGTLISSSGIKRRPLLVFHQTKYLRGVFPALDESDLPEICEVFQSSFFIIPSMLPLWLQAVQYFNIQRFDWCIALLLPQLEHGLRRVFACINNCPHRVLTAESTVLYTTFDEILAPALPDGSSNLLKDEIGGPYLEMLLDILVHPEGPRIRDHISHGEVDLTAISRELASHILCICIAFARKYIVLNEKQPHDSSIVETICETAANYKSVFHPVSIVVRTTQDLVRSLREWQELPKPHGEDFNSLSSIGTNYHHCFSEAEKAFDSLKMASAVEKWPYDWSSSLHLHQFDEFFLNVSQWLNAPFPTLFRPKSEIEVVLLLKRIAQHGFVISAQICEVVSVRFHQLERRQLRQRQRANYARLWSHLPRMLAFLQLLVAVVLSELMLLSQDGHQENRTSLIRFLKKCLQCSENIESLSNMSRNRWDECCALAKTFVKYTEQYYCAQCQKTVEIFMEK